ncbi:hypothetical protein E2C01_080569 [Portunus trituberculatus]|uniref:Uncharacterized protein n=1 Tax=Portunus trituberculatus TaxID=210409 RepID=A0A5B7IVR4_PORTR|nr:hypothetical protein [Portunus trituberculatus]
MAEGRQSPNSMCLQGANYLAGQAQVVPARRFLPQGNNPKLLATTTADRAWGGCPRHPGASLLRLMVQTLRHTFKVSRHKTPF